MRRSSVALCVMAALSLAAADAKASSTDPREILYSIPLPDLPPRVTELTFLKDMLGGLALNRSRYIQAIVQLAEEHKVPLPLVDAVVRIESAYDPAAIGGVGEIGLMQVRPTTAAMLGFRGSLAELAHPETNLRYGVTYLAQAWRLAGGDLCRTLMKYRAGHGEERMSALSEVYCMRARRHLASLSALGQIEGAASGFSLAEIELARSARQRIVAPGVRSVRRAHPMAVSQGGFRQIGYAAPPAGYVSRRIKAVAKL